MKDVYDGSNPDTTTQLSLLTLCDSPVTYSVHNAVPLLYILNQSPRYYVLFFDIQHNIKRALYNQFLGARRE